MRTLLWPLLVLGNALLLCGCADVTTAGYTADEDAMPAPGSSPARVASSNPGPGKSGLASLTSGPAYGASNPTSAGMPATTHRASTITALTTGPTYGATHFEKTNLYGPPDKSTVAEPALSSADEEPFDNLEIVSPGLKSRLTVTRVGSDRTDDNLLTVFAGLKNKSSRPLPIEVQTLYKDKRDHSLSDGRKSWVPLTLKPHEEMQYRSVAISEAATDFVVRIRHAAP
jgi:hypothetical protein